MVSDIMSDPKMYFFRCIRANNLTIILKSVKIIRCYLLIVFFGSQGTIDLHRLHCASVSPVEYSHPVSSRVVPVVICFAFEKNSNLVMLPQNLQKCLTELFVPF
jgi:hypothetical protein